MLESDYVWNRRKFRTYSTERQIANLERLLYSGMLAKKDSRSISDKIHSMRLRLMGLSYEQSTYTPDPRITKALEKMVANRNKRLLEARIERDQKKRARKRKRQERRRAERKTHGRHAK